MSFLAVQNLSRHLNHSAIVNNISFTQQPLQKIAIAGETGSGKSTLLRMIAGLVQPDGGNSYFLDERIEGPYEKLIPGHAGIAYLSQQYELPKFLRVEQVLQYANKIAEKEAQILYEICRITHLMKRRTDELSGGEQQRIAMARLLIGLPKLFLLDEPFSNLDPIHKSILKTVLEDVEERLQVSFILTSHDPLDTLSWVDEILVIKEGNLLQQAPPETVYYQPVNEYVAGLFGPYQIVSPQIYQAFTGITSLPEGKKIIIRPERFRMEKEGNSGIPAVVKRKIFTGSNYDIILELPGESITIRTGFNLISPGDTLLVSAAPEAFWFV